MLALNARHGGGAYFWGAHLATSAQRDDSATFVPTVRHRRSRTRALLSSPALWLSVYLVSLAFIAFWPTRIDRPADDWIDAVTTATPWLTYARIEFAANILLFLPFGFLFVATLRGRPVVALLLAIAVSIMIETGQALFLVERDTTIRDVVANAVGAVAGILLALLVLRRQRRGASPP